ncbi:MAG TPA: hypothetical protein VJK51_02935 [Candidatus Nanoarchaeia archaeon]|nr:hypothetical protein [Candidatus Nanoarchaeia archaeon]
MKEYLFEDGTNVELGQLKVTEQLSLADYQKAHQSLPIMCHDVFIFYRSGILLVYRDNFPAKNEYWPIGGRLQRGVPVVDSLRDKVQKECGLQLKDIVYIDLARHFFRTAPFDLKKGTDTPCAVYAACGEGILKLDTLHSKPLLVVPEGVHIAPVGGCVVQEYTPEFSAKLHPYVREFLSLGLERFFGKQ